MKIKLILGDLNNIPFLIIWIIKNFLHYLTRYCHCWIWLAHNCLFKLLLKVLLLHLLTNTYYKTWTEVANNIMAKQFFNNPFLSAFKILFRLNNGFILFRWKINNIKNKIWMQRFYWTKTKHFITLIYLLQFPQRCQQSSI